MRRPRSGYTNCVGYDMHFMEWGDKKAAPVVLWHGLARTGRDFDSLAAHLATRYRVIAPDTIGRGLSQWALDPNDYRFSKYHEIAMSLFDYLKIDKMRWVGTSMGGLIGMTLAATSLSGRITHLVLNDIGPEIAPEAIKRIVTYVGNPPHFASIPMLRDFYRTVYATFGAQEENTWRHLAETGYRRADDGSITVHYDPRIVNQFSDRSEELDLWPAFRAIECPILLLRGSQSDVLSGAVAAEMTSKGNDCRLVTIPEVGHAPMLNTKDQQAAVEHFLDEEVANVRPNR